VQKNAVVALAELTSSNNEIRDAIAAQPGAISLLVALLGSGNVAVHCTAALGHSRQQQQPHPRRHRRPAWRQSLGWWRCWAAAM
jgi:hypothetical protein